MTVIQHVIGLLRYSEEEAFFFLNMRYSEVKFRISHSNTVSHDMGAEKVKGPLAQWPNSGIWSLNLCPSD